MALRLTPEQALKMGIPLVGMQANGDKKSKRQSIIDAIAEIRNSNVQMERIEGGYRVTITGVPIPSWNTVLRWDLKTEFHSYNKAWHRRIHEAALESGMHRERRTDRFLIKINVDRKRLLDYDNICVKQVIDGCVRSGLIKDDSPKFMAGYDVRQKQAKENKTVIIFQEQQKEEGMIRISEIENLVDVDKDIIHLAFQVSDDLGIAAYKNSNAEFKQFLNQDQGVTVFSMNLEYRTYTTKLLAAVTPLLKEEQKAVFLKTAILG